MWRVGTIPEPTEVLKGPRNGKTFLPPRSRSPIKTNLGSSPRRSMGTASSPSRFYNQTPTRATSHPVNESVLDMSKGDLTPSVEASELEGQSSQLKRVKKAQLNGRGVKRPFNLSLDDDDDDTALSASPLPTAPPLPLAGSDHAQISPAPPRAKPGRGRPPKVPKSGSFVTDVVGSATEQPKATNEELPIQMEDEIENLEQEPEQEAEKVDREDDEPAAEVADAGEPTKKRRGRKAALARKDENNKMKPPPKPKMKPAPRKPQTVSKQLNKSSSRSLYVSRSETPAQDSGARTTRAGRNVLKPVAYWRGERIVYGDGLLEGSTLTLPGIKEVIRTEEVAAPKPKRSGYRRSRPKPRAEGGQEVEEEEEEEEEREPWETEAGIVRAQVLQWDSISGRYDEENTEEAGKSMQAVLSPILFKSFPH